MLTIREHVLIGMAFVAMLACCVACLFLAAIAAMHAPAWALNGFGAWCAFYLAHQLTGWMGRKVDEEKRAFESDGGNTV